MIKIPPLSIPGLFVTATDTGVGKTIIAAAISRHLRTRGGRVAVLKPVASGCIRTREGLVSEDAELLAAASDTPHPLDLICPNRYEEPLTPSVAARRAKQPVDWEAVERSIAIMSLGARAMVVEGVGGVLAPLDDQHTVRDLILALRVPVVVVARAGLGTINHTLLTIECLRAAGAAIAGVVINQYPSDGASVAEETSSREIERLGKVLVLTIVPREPITLPHLPAGILSAIDQVDWESKLAAGSMPRA